MDKKNLKITKYNDLEGKFLLINVGTEEHPATNEMIADIERKIVKLLECNDVNCMVFVTHHAVKMTIIENKLEVKNDIEEQ